MMRRRRPLRRAAVVGGVAAVAHHAGKKSGEAEAAQQAQYAEPQYAEPQYAPPPPAAPAPSAGGTDMVTELTNLKQLLDAGVLTQEEFDVQKQKVLAQS